MTEYTLSSGVKVIFNRIAESTATEVMVNSFANMKFDKKGNLVDATKVDEQLEAASKIQNYHNKLIAFGVELAGTIDEYTILPGIGRNWLSKLKYSDTNLTKFDLNDEEDLKFLFLRYYAFKAASDFEALSKYTIGNE